MFHKLRLRANNNNNNNNNNKKRKILKETKQKFIKAIVEKLDSLHEDDPISFWKSIDNLKKGVQIQDNPISLSPSALYRPKLSGCCFNFFPLLLSSLLRK
jgi:hypothetical protein